MNSDDLVTIDRFLFIADAEVARATLEAAGIDAVLVDENIVRMSWGDAQAHGGVRLQVRAEDADEARAILEETVLDEPPAPPPPQSFEDTEPDETCRRCGSEEIYPAESRAKIYTRAVLKLAFGFFLIFVISAGAEAAGGEISFRLMSIGQLIVVMIFVVTVIFDKMLPKKRCRNCGLEWRGTPRTN